MLGLKLNDVSKRAIGVSTKSLKLDLTCPKHREVSIVMMVYTTYLLTLHPYLAGCLSDKDWDDWGEVRLIAFWIWKQFQETMNNSMFKRGTIVINSDIDDLKNLYFIYEKHTIIACKGPWIPTYETYKIVSVHILTKYFSQTLDWGIFHLSLIQLWYGNKHFLKM